MSWKLLCGKVSNRAADDIKKLVADSLKKQNAPKSITIKKPDSKVVVDMGIQHEQFETLLKMSSAVQANGNRLNIWIAGPAGTGKTTAAVNVAKALELPFAATGSLVELYNVFGYVTADGNYVSTEFRRIWENGGLFVFDDFDASDPQCVVGLNNALANGTCSFPDKTVPRHKDTILILTANTWGLGGTNEYVGRMRQDAAFLDRFVKLFWDIDEKLELATCPNTEWVKRVQAVRAKVITKGIKGVLVTPRASYFGAALLDTGMSQKEVEHSTLAASMDKSYWNSVK